MIFSIFDNDFHIEFSAVTHEDTVTNGQIDNLDWQTGNVEDSTNDKIAQQNRERKFFDLS